LNVSRKVGTGFNLGMRFFYLGNCEHDWIDFD
jgi:hypothetical protein